MAKSDQLVRILDGCTSLDKSNIKDLIQQGNITTLKNSISGPVNVSDTNKTFLETYRRALERKKEKARKIKLIKNNFSRIEDIFDELEEEVNQAKDEERTLEELADDFDNKDVQEKIESYDKPEIDKLNKKLKHLISLKKEMENREQTLEQITSSYSNISKAVEQRIDLTTDIINKAGSGGGSPNPKIISISDVEGDITAFKETIGLIDKSGRYGDFNSVNEIIRSNEFELVVNGNALGNPFKQGDKNMLQRIMRGINNDDLIYIFGRFDQFILFNEYWRAAKKLDGNNLDDDALHMNIGKTPRLAFIEKMIERKPAVRGSWGNNSLTTSSFEYEYCSSGPYSNLFSDLEAVAAYIGKVANPSGGLEAMDLIREGDYRKQDFMNILQSLNSGSTGLYENSSDNGFADLSFSSLGDIGEPEARVAVQYLLQFQGDKFLDESLRNGSDRSDTSNLSQEATRLKNIDTGKLFDPTKPGCLWEKWNSWTSRNPSGKFIVGRTEQSDTNGNSLFSGGNPKTKNSKDYIDECTIPSSRDENCLVVEEPNGKITALKDDGSGGVAEKTIQNN